MIRLDQNHPQSFMIYKVGCTIAHWLQVWAEHVRKAIVSVQGWDERHLLQVLQPGKCIRRQGEWAVFGKSWEASTAGRLPCWSIIVREGVAGCRDGLPRERLTRERWPRHGCHKGYNRPRHRNSWPALVQGWIWIIIGSITCFAKQDTLTVHIKCKTHKKLLLKPNWLFCPDLGTIHVLAFSLFRSVDSQTPLQAHLSICLNFGRRKVFSPLLPTSYLPLFSHISLFCCRPTRKSE